MTRTRSRSKECTPPAPLGVKETVAAKARKRRETQRALTEIRARAPYEAPQRPRAVASIRDGANRQLEAGDPPGAPPR